MARPRASEARDTRAALLDAGLDAFAESGFEGASVRDIARRAGVTDAALYHWFASKEALLVAVVEATAVGRVAAVEAAIRGSAGRSLRATLKDILERVAADPSTARSLKLLQVLLSSGEQLAHVLPKLAEQLVPVIAHVAERFEELRRSGRVRAGVPSPVFALHLIAPVTMLWLAEARGLPLPFTAASVMDAHVDFMVHALAPKAARKRRA